ncbi:MAG: Tm-1-like ATP-binding domain-containing protein [Solirubrobacteraceae bacterium]
MSGEDGQGPRAPVVVLIGTFDTKGQEYARLAELVVAAGGRPVLVDVGIGQSDAQALVPDVDAETVVRAGGTDLAVLRSDGDRGAAVGAMEKGAAEIALGLHAQRRLDGIAALGGSGGTAIATAAMRALPFGVPKLMVSTLASGDVSAYVRGVDITMSYPVVDPVGENEILDTVLRSAAGAIVGMARAGMTGGPPRSERPVVAATMFGVTTAGVTAARTRLQDEGYDVLTFHATGVGGDGMERLIASGRVDAVADLTTTELADELVGGIHPAGPDRLRTAGRLGIPQVISVGALDMVNFGPLQSVPARFADRRLVRHNPHVTLMRTTPEECAVLGRRLTERARAARGPVLILLPLRGISALAVVGGPFHDPAADAALFDAIHDGCGESIELLELDLEINDPAFGQAAAECLLELRARTAATAG